MKYLWCTIMTSKMEESMAFYQEVIGLEIERQQEMGSKKLVFLTDGNVNVELIYDPEYQPLEKIEGISIGFGVDDLDDAMALMQQKKVAIAEGPYAPNPHVTFFYVRDPNGVKVQIFKAMP